MTLTSSSSPPAATGAATGTPILYATLTPNAYTTFTSGGVVSGSVTIPSGLSPSGTYSLELYAPTQGWLVDPTPGTVTGNTVTFSYTLPNAITVYPVTYDIAISKTN